MTTPFISISD